MFDNHSLYFSYAFVSPDAFGVSKFDAGVASVSVLVTTVTEKVASVSL